MRRFLICILIFSIVAGCQRQTELTPVQYRAVRLDSAFAHWIGPRRNSREETKADIDANALAEGQDPASYHSVVCPLPLDRTRRDSFSSISLNTDTDLFSIEALKGRWFVFDDTERRGKRSPARVEKVDFQNDNKWSGTFLSRIDNVTKDGWYDIEEGILLIAPPGGDTGWYTIETIDNAYFIARMMARDELLYHFFRQSTENER